MKFRDLVFTQSTKTARWQSQQLRIPGEPEARTYTVIDRSRDVADRNYTMGGFAIRLLRNGLYSKLHAGGVPGGLSKLELAAFIAGMEPAENPKPYRCTTTKPRKILPTEVTE
ncbi:hypothetical protein [Methylobacterium sp. 285MFTsu5.1]|uniref:hypothetical protein n=1 Tax=Methylobacterium sp. 285MFTsu5.1 TaxID=1172187 RepID=UPI00038251DC|nr:hypothetical protein [Methylobacterium sp. 285MFTsu5.1]